MTIGDQEDVALNSGVRRLGRYTSAIGPLEDNELSKRALMQPANEPGSSEVPSTTSVGRARNMPKSANASLPAIELARFIAGTCSPSDELIAGLHVQLSYLRGAVHWKNKRRSLSELRDLSHHVHLAATCLRSFPENGQLPKPKMGKAERAVKVLQDCLEDTELLSYLFKDSAPIIQETFVSTLEVISERTSGASAPKNGRPKKQKDLHLPYWDQFLVELDWIANLALDGEVGVRIKKRMTPSQQEREQFPGQRTRDRVYEREQAAEKFSPQLLCAVIIGIGYATVLTEVHWSKRSVKFTENASEACEMLWLAAGGGEHKEHRDQTAIYSSWQDWIRAARETSCRDFVGKISRSFR